MPQHKIAPACPYCNEHALYCYGVISKSNGKVRYFVCDNCGVRLARNYENHVERWAGLVRPTRCKAQPA